MTHARARAVLCCFGVLMIVAFVVVAACGSGMSEPSIDPQTVDSGHSSTISELIASSSAISFTVILRPKGKTSGDEVIVWRQGGGLRRWDIIHERASPELGSFEVQSRIDANGGFSASEEACDWDQYGDSSQAHVSCGEGSSDPLLMDLDESVLLPVQGPPIPQQIRGRPARCYTVDAPSAHGASFCFDEALQMPLRLAAGGLEYEATSVDTAIVSLSLPVPLTLNPELEPLHIREADTSVRLDELQLPRVR